MANIYLKMPTYVAQFFRNRDVKNKLTEFQPVKFSPFETPSTIMATWLMTVPEGAMEHTSCLSQRMWKNMLDGKPPQGGRVLINRSAEEWPTMDEVITLTKEKRNQKTDGFDYLCIEAPKTIIVGQQYKNVTTSFTLPFTAANDMIRWLRQEFVRRIINWVRKEMAYCDQVGIQRDMVMCVDHFFYHYEMCLGTNGTDRESMRRMVCRWMNDAHLLTEDMNDEDVLFLYQSEREEQLPSIDTLLREVKQGVNIS